MSRGKGSAESPAARSITSFAVSLHSQYHFARGNGCFSRHPVPGARCGLLLSSRCRVWGHDAVSGVTIRTPAVHRRCCRGYVANRDWEAAPTSLREGNHPEYHEKAQTDVHGVSSSDSRAEASS